MRKWFPIEGACPREEADEPKSEQWDIQHPEEVEICKPTETSIFTQEEDTISDMDISMKEDSVDDRSTHTVLEMALTEAEILDITPVPSDETQRDEITDDNQVMLTERAYNEVISLSVEEQKDIVEEVPVSIELV